MSRQKRLVACLIKYGWNMNVLSWPDQHLRTATFKAAVSLENNRKIDRSYRWNSILLISDISRG